MSDIVERLRRGHHNADLITVGGVTHDGRCLVAADEIARLRTDLAAAQEREQRMREALANIMGNMEPDPDDPDRRRMLSNGFARWEALEDDARAALSAMRGEP